MNINLKIFHLKNLINELKRNLEFDLIPMMDDWFKAKALPGYLISPITAVKVKSGDMMRTMVSFESHQFF